MKYFINNCIPKYSTLLPRYELMWMETLREYSPLEYSVHPRSRYLLLQVMRKIMLFTNICTYVQCKYIQEVYTIYRQQKNKNRAYTHELYYIYAYLCLSNGFYIYTRYRTRDASPCQFSVEWVKVNVIFIQVFVLFPHLFPHCIYRRMLNEITFSTDIQIQACFSPPIAMINKLIKKILLKTTTNLFKLRSVNNWKSIQSH